MNNLLKTLINRMSKVTNTTLTDRHLELLEYAYNYYEKNRVGPLYQNIKKITGANKEEIESLFPYGLTSLYTWVGIPIQSTNDLCKPLATVEVDDYREVYFDHNATTFVRDEIKSCIKEFYSGDFCFGNPSSSTNIGKQAYDILHTARNQIAKCIGVNTDEIVFTGSGSEANNMAIKGIAFKHIKNKGHLISSNVEHPAVLKTLEFLEEIGFDVTYLNVNKDGRITPHQVEESLRENTILVSIMAVNNEIGVINPIAEIGSLCQSRNIPFMVDAVQGFGKIDLDPKSSGISLMSLSGHKIYAPKGVGALYISKDTTLIPLIHGGSQENGSRAGTENVVSIMAFGKAAELAHSEIETERKRFTELRNYFLECLKEVEPGFILNGVLEHHVPNNLNIGFPGIDSGSLLLSLNHIGVYVSAGSACSAGSSEASYVIKALNVDTDKYGIIRFSFGLPNTKEDIDYLFKYLPVILEKLKSETK